MAPPSSCNAALVEGDQVHFRIAHGIEQLRRRLFDRLAIGVVELGVAALAPSGHGVLTSAREKT